MGSIPGRMLLVVAVLEEVGSAGILVVASVGTIGRPRWMLRRLLLVNGPRLLLLLLLMFLSLSPSWVVVGFGWWSDEDRSFCDGCIRNEGLVSHKEANARQGVEYRGEVRSVPRSTPQIHVSNS